MAFHGHIKKYIDSMTYERILRLAARPGDSFRLSRYRHRDAPIAERVAILVKEGKLKKIARTSDVVLYQITERGRAELITRKDTSHGD